MISSEQCVLSVNESSPINNFSYYKFRIRKKNVPTLSSRKQNREPFYCLLIIGKNLLRTFSSLCVIVSGLYSNHNYFDIFLQNNLNQNYQLSFVKVMIKAKTYTLIFEESFLDQVDYFCGRFQVFASTLDSEERSCNFKPFPFIKLKLLSKGSLTAIPKNGIRVGSNNWLVDG